VKAFATAAEWFGPPSRLRIAEAGPFSVMERQPEDGRDLSMKKEPHHEGAAPFLSALLRRSQNPSATSLARVEKQGGTARGRPFRRQVQARAG